MDPLAADGTFFDGGGNSVGFYDAKNHAVYSYAHNNPIIITDPDGNDIILRGRNGSKIVVKTSLISFEANVSAGAFAMDFRGQFELKGSDILHFALDVVGIFDPSGVADAINGGLYLEEGNYLDAAISGVGILAYVGDTAKVFRLWKGFDKVKDMLKLKPCGCFTAGTQVLTEDGYKNIEDIQKGDIVWAYDDKTGDLKPKKVTETYTLDFSQIFKLYIGDEIIEVTHEHPFFIGGKWLHADELKVGDFVTLYDGTAKRIDKIDFISNGKFKVYTFEVEDYHSYFVGQSKILVHNGNPCDILAKTLVDKGKGLLDNSLLQNVDLDGFFEINKSNAFFSISDIDNKGVKGALKSVTELLENSAKQADSEQATIMFMTVVNKDLKDPKIGKEIAKKLGYDFKVIEGSSGTNVIWTKKMK